MAELTSKEDSMESNMQVKFIGYDTRIIYDDYSTHEVLVQELSELQTICKNLENRDDTFYIEYKKKYALEDGSFVYSKKEHYEIDNPNIPQKELYLRKFNDVAQVISYSLDVRDEDLEKCHDILNKLLDNNEIKVSELTLVASFRYALGRRSYIVAEVVENILNNWQNLSEKIKTNIKEEIDEAVSSNSFGDQTDLDLWNKIKREK